ncbi:hypothetical protein JL720_9268 [Aureococcus anophagefferens]|nr:hypothetical protein JL720_9268 [Aureococcus anophagefferens]
MRALLLAACAASAVAWTAPLEWTAPLRRALGGCLAGACLVAPTLARAERPLPVVEEVVNALSSRGLDVGGFDELRAADAVARALDGYGGVVRFETSQLARALGEAAPLGVALVKDSAVRGALTVTAAEPASRRSPGAASATPSSPSTAAKSTTARSSNRGAVVGERTFGKGTAQSLFPLRSAPGAALRLTTARVAVQGRALDGAGVAPDVVAEKSSGGLDALLVAKGAYFDFASEFARSHPGLADDRVEAALAADLRPAWRAFLARGVDVDVGLGDYPPEVRGAAGGGGAAEALSARAAGDAACLRNAADALRTGTYPEMQENLRLAVTEPLEDADVFAVVAREHMLKHIDYHIPRNGCYFDRRKCARRDGSEGDGWRNLTGPHDLDPDWGKRRRAARPPATDAELEGLRTGPLKPRRVTVLDDDAAVAAATAKHGAARADLFQRSLRARNRVCLDHIEEAEAERGAKYDFVIRIRPDYAFFACRLPPAAYWPRGENASQWFSSHMDLWEAMGRDAAESNLGMWGRPVPDACHRMPRVESCPHYVMCGRGGRGHAAEAIGGRQDGLGPVKPGEFLRPCCDARDIPRQVLDPPPETWCALERAPYLHDWWYSYQARPNRHNRARKGLAPEAANAALGPHCAKIPLDYGRPDDDDDDDDDDRAAAGDDAWLAEFPRPAPHAARAAYKAKKRAANGDDDDDDDATLGAGDVARQAVLEEAAARAGDAARAARRRNARDDDDDDDDRSELR